MRLKRHPFVMPNNYFVGEKLESEEQALASIKKSLAELPLLAEAVKEETSPPLGPSRARGRRPFAAIRAVRPRDVHEVREAGLPFHGFG